MVLPRGSGTLSSLQLVSACSGWPFPPQACSATLAPALGHPWYGWEVPCAQWGWVRLGFRVRGGSTCRRPQCQSQQLEPCWVRGACHPQGSLCLAVGSQSRDRWHKSCRVFIFPRLLPRTISRSPGLDRLWSELRENCRAHQGSKGPACPTSGKDARYISAPACVASAQITSSCMIVVSP